MNPLKFIHLTDPHIVGGNALLHGADPRAKLRLAVESINREHGDAAFVAVTGDLTDVGDADAYNVFGEEIEKLHMPFELMMGNHDVAGAFATRFPDAPRDANGFVQSVRDTEMGRCIFLDTSDAESHAGKLCSKRLDWLSTQLAGSNAPVFLFLHHPPFPVGLKGMDSIALKDPNAFWAVISPHKTRIRHMFFGHLHRMVSGNWRGISYSCMRGPSHQVALDLDAGPTIVRGSHESPAYGVVLADSEQVVVHMHDYGDHSPRFVYGAEDE